MFKNVIVVVFYVENKKNKKIFLIFKIEIIKN